jgi:hypothetical protein
VAYHLHIRRVTPEGDSLPVALAEWHAAVAKTKGVRLAEGPLKITNPKTGEIISIGNSGGDAEVLFFKEQQWLRVFYWSPDGIYFAPGRNFGDLPFRHIVLELARHLNASVVGDEGEMYA